MEAVYLILMAIIPPVLLMCITYMLDKKEREPLSLLIVLFIMGVISIVPAWVLEKAGKQILSIWGLNKGMYMLIYAFLVIGIAEEGSKYFLLKLVSWKHPAFNYRFDGIVYAVYVSLGFALAENVLYVQNYGVKVAIMRALTAIPLHASCGVLMGIYYGFARGCAYAGNNAGKKKNSRIALFIPIFVHGFYDFSVMVEDEFMYIIWIAFTVTIFGTVILRLIKYSKNDHPIVIENEELQMFGQKQLWFPQEHSYGRSTQLLRNNQIADNQQAYIIGNQGSSMNFVSAQFEKQRVDIERKNAATGTEKQSYNIEQMAVINGYSAKKTDTDSEVFENQQQMIHPDLFDGNISREWICRCGSKNNQRFCPLCGSDRFIVNQN